MLKRFPLFVTPATLMSVGKDSVRSVHRKMREMRLRRIAWQIAGVLVLVAGAALPSSAQVVVAGNLGTGGTFQPGTGTAWATGPGAPPCNDEPCDPANAVAFTVPGTTSYTMTQFKVAINWSAGSNSVTVGVYMYPGPNSATAINSATLLQSFTLSSPADGTGQAGLLVTQAVTTPILLVPGNTYFLEMTNSNAGGDFGWQWNDTGQTGYYAEFLPCGETSPCWFAEPSPDATPAFEVDGTPTEAVFVSTQYGGQILAVDGTTGAFSVVYQALGCRSDGAFCPEGMVVGPDDKLYITDPTDKAVRRMNQNGTQEEYVYAPSECETCPGAPQGPGFSASATGDLYFNTQNSDSGTGVFAITSVGTTVFGGPFNSPVNVVPGTGTCTTPSCVNFSPGAGYGATFDSGDNLVFVEQGGGSIPESVLSVSPPYTTGYSPTTLVSGLANPTGVALNPVNGQLYVAETGNGDAQPEILAIGSGGATTTYFTFTTSTTCLAADGGVGSDLPVFMQFDLSGRLFVVTTTDISNDGQGCGKVWRIDPAGSSPVCVESATPCSNLLVDFNSVYNNGIEGVCSAPCGLNSSQAIGLALPATSGPSQTQIATGLAQIMLFSFDNDRYSIQFDLFAGMLHAGATVTVTPQEISQADWTARVCPGSFCGTKIAPVSGEGGNGIILPAVCLYGGSPCVNTIPYPYGIETTWQSTQPKYCGSGPGLLRGDPIGIDTILVDTLTSCAALSDPGYGTGGTSKCTNSSVTDCLSDWVNVFGIGGPIVNASPFSVNFGNVPVGSLRLDAITLENTGTTNLAISSVAIAPVSGGDSDDFFSLNFCPGTLGVGKSCIVLVGFLADADDFNPQSATLTITDSAAGSPQSILLAAQVVKKH
jgi:hypothetical protein